MSISIASVALTDASRFNICSEDVNTALKQQGETETRKQMSNSKIEQKGGAVPAAV